MEVQWSFNKVGIRTAGSESAMPEKTIEHERQNQDVLANQVFAIGLNLGAGFMGIPISHSGSNVSRLPTLLPLPFWAGLVAAQEAYSSQTCPLAHIRVTPLYQTACQTANQCHGHWKM